MESAGSLWSLFLRYRRYKSSVTFASLDPPPASPSSWRQGPTTDGEGPVRRRENHKAYHRNLYTESPKKWNLRYLGKTTFTVVARKRVHVGPLFSSHPFAPLLHPSVGLGPAQPKWIGREISSLQNWLRVRLIFCFDVTLQIVCLHENFAYPFQPSPKRVLRFTPISFQVRHEHIRSPRCRVLSSRGWCRRSIADVRSAAVQISDQS